jgi:hypothetical protein
LHSNRADARDAFITEKKARDKLADLEDIDGNEMRWCQVLIIDPQDTGERQQR